MKICAVICEFNPFHNGHKYLIERAKAMTECDRLVCIMSGSFTQRGEICIMDKFARARHAVLCGADAVIELPAAFAVAPAEIFASGAIKILSSVPEVTTVAFGCENDGRAEFLKSAEILLNESESFKKTLESGLSGGESYIKSCQKAFEAAGGDGEMLAKPNNVLAVEYTKAILRAKKNIDICPVKRVGAGYNDGNLMESFSSASAIRQNATSPLLKNNLPECVLNDLGDFSAANKRFEEYLRLILTRTDAEALKNIYGCREGLENKLKELEALSFNEIIASATSRRYSSARIKRILCANFLGIFQPDCEEFLKNPLYIKPLAVNRQCADEVLSALAKSEYPVLTKGRDKLNLNKVAKKCLALDEFSYLQWQITAQKSGLANQDSLIFI